MSKPRIKRSKPIKGIVSDAKQLGVSHPHLWMVLKGKRESASLLRRYQELQNRKAQKVSA